MMVLGLLGTTSSVKQKMGICLRGHTSLLEKGTAGSPRDGRADLAANIQPSEKKKTKLCHNLIVTNWNSSPAYAFQNIIEIPDSEQFEERF